MRLCHTLCPSAKHSAPRTGRQQLTECTPPSTGSEILDIERSCEIGFVAVRLSAYAARVGGEG